MPKSNKRTLSIRPLPETEAPVDMEKELDALNRDQLQRYQTYIDAKLGEKESAAASSERETEDTVLQDWIAALLPIVIPCIVCILGIAIAYTCLYRPTRVTMDTFIEMLDKADCPESAQILARQAIGQRNYDLKWTWAISNSDYLVVSGNIHLVQGNGADIDLYIEMDNFGKWNINTWDIQIKPKATDGELDDFSQWISDHYGKLSDEKVVDEFLKYVILNLQVA